MSILPIASKVRSGPRWIEADAPVVHVPGGLDVSRAIRPKAKANKRPAFTATALPIVAEMRGRAITFAIEREAIRKRKESGQPWPWTDDPILRAGHFCNVHREHDRTTRQITNSLVQPYHNVVDLWFVIAAARCINEPGTLKEIERWLPFEADYLRGLLEARQARGERVFRTMAYKPPTPPNKGTSTIDFLVDEVLGPLWRDRETLRPQASETLAAYSDRLRERYRIGPFLAGQIIADLKQVEPLKAAADWETFAVPGPGSMRGLNRVCDRPLKATWPEPQWLATLLQLREDTAPAFAAADIAPLDAQSMQSVCCEFDKLERAREAGGVPSRKYQAAAAARPVKAKRPAETLTETLTETLAETAPLVDQVAATVSSPSLAPDISDYILSDEAATAGPQAKSVATSKPPPGGSKSAAEEDSYAQDHAGEPFNDAWLLRRGYSCTRTFDYTLPDGTVLYEQRRYELRADIPAIKGRPRKRFLPRRPSNGVWLTGAGARRILYNWPAIMRPGPGATVFIPEGEGKVDDLTAKGLLATTVVSHDWAPECVAALSGYELIILCDHDAQGESLAADARGKLVATAASLRVVPYPHLWRHLPAEQRGAAPAPHDDISDWLAKGGDPAKLLDICREIPAEGEIWIPAPIHLWAGQEVPLPEFTVEDRIPAGQVFLYSGEGGGGKSAQAEHLCAAHALGREWLGVIPRQGPAIYIECEDAERVLWWRLAAIAAYYGVPIETFASAGLQLFSLVEHDTILAFTNKRGIVEPTAAYKRLYEMAGDIKPVQIAIASVANIFAGSEINRTEVQQFIKLLNRIPALTKGSLTLVSQPSLTGIASSDVSHKGLSGTTQWHNAVRGRAAVEIIKPKDSAGNGLDTGLRTLTFYKNQYGPPVAGQMLRWQNGLWLPVGGTTLAGAERANFADELTITLLARFTAQNRSVSINVNPANYAPTHFAKADEAQAAGLTSEDFRKAVERLLQQGVIENREFRKGSEVRTRLVLSDKEEEAGDHD
jgi:RecA-family ATPase